MTPDETVERFNAWRWTGCPVRYWSGPERAGRGVLSHTAGPAHLDAYGVPVVDVQSRTAPVRLELLEPEPAYRCPDCPTRPVYTGDTWTIADGRYFEHWWSNHRRPAAEVAAELAAQWRAELGQLRRALPGWTVWHDDPAPVDQVGPVAMWHAVRAPADLPIGQVRTLPGQLTALDPRGLYDQCRSADQERRGRRRRAA